MRWCLRVKLAQNHLKFGLLLEATNPLPIVELSVKDSFWGAEPNKSQKDHLVGVNALGRLIMELREEYISLRRYRLLVVSPLNINNFLMLNIPLTTIDERANFVNTYIDNNYTL